MTPAWVAAMLSLLRSPALVATSAFALGGVGFAVANLLLARALPAQEFAVLSLFLAINQIGLSAGTLGIEVPINRHRLPATPALLRRTLLGAVPVATASGLVATAFYGLGGGVALCLGGTILASTANTVASALFRSTRQFVPGLLLTQLQNYALLAIAGAALLLPLASAGSIASLVALAYASGAAIGWIALRRRDAGAVSRPLGPEVMKEGLAAIGFSVAGMIMLQYERLVIPSRLTMTDLAVFSVASSLAAAPFRMLQTGVGFTLLPRLRACASIDQVRRVVLREAAVSAAAMLGLAVAVWQLAPWVLRTVLEGRYEVPEALLVAILSVGAVRVASAFAEASVLAMGRPGDLFRGTIWAWVGVALGGACAVAGTRFGLPGVVYGTGAGWLLIALASAAIAVQASARWSSELASGHPAE